MTTLLRNAGATAAILLFANAALADGWERETIEAARTPLEDCVVDRDGAVWIVAEDGAVLTDRDGRWTAVGTHASSRFFGRRDRGAYATQSGAAGQPAVLMSLDDASRRTTLGDASGPAGPGIVVARDGTVIQYDAEHARALRDDGTWNESVATLSDVAWQVSACDFTPDGPLVLVAGQADKATIWDGATFHADQRVPHLRPGATRGRHLLNARAAGDKYIIAWIDNQPEFSLIEVKQDTDGTPVLERIDKSFITRQMETPRRIRGGWSHDDGSVWLFIECANRVDRDIIRIGADAHVTSLGVDATRRIARRDSPDARPRHAPRSLLANPDGSAWFGLSEHGLVRVHPGAELPIATFGWAERVRENDVRWLLRDAAGNALAVSASGALYRWSETAASESAWTLDWSEVVDVTACGPVAAPDRTLWMHRDDRRGHASRWDGAAWRDTPVDYDASRVVQAAADDRGRLVVVLDEDGGAVVIDGNDVTRADDLSAALATLVDDGARAFGSAGLVGPAVGPAVGSDARIWWARAGDDRVRARTDEGWSDLTVSGLRAILVDTDGAPWFADDVGWQRLADGTLTRVPPAAHDDLLRIATSSGVGALPYHADAPVDPATALPLTHTGGTRGQVPVTWADAARIAAEGTYARPPALDRSPIRDAQHAFPTGDGAFWLSTKRNGTMRVRDDTFVVLDGRERPYATRGLHAAGVDPAGHAWIGVGRFGAGWHVLLRHGG